MNSSYAIKVETLYIGVSFFVKYFECCQKLSILGCNFANKLQVRLRFNIILSPSAQGPLVQINLVLFYFMKLLLLDN